MKLQKLGGYAAFGFLLVFIIQAVFNRLLMQVV